MPDMPPPVALRTYTSIRLGVVAVIVALGFAVWREIANSPDDCVQRSLSAYYYTPVRPVFVGALLIIGFAMIVLWGITPWEDTALNLAGLLLTGRCARSNAGRELLQPPEAQRPSPGTGDEANCRQCTDKCER